jgi:hypothetical protein
MNALLLIRDLGSAYLITVEMCTKQPYVKRIEKDMLTNSLIGTIEAEYLALLSMRGLLK